MNISKMVETEFRMSKISGEMESPMPIEKQGSLNPQGNDFS